MEAVGAPSADIEGFRHLYDDTKSEVYWYLRDRCGDPGLAEDLTSEVFVKGLREWHAGRRDVVTIAWLVRVARNQLIDHWRRQESEQRRLRKVAGGAEDLDLPFESEGLDPEEVRRALDRLSPSHRAALTLKYIDGCSLAETATALDRGVKATGSLLERARRALREALEDRDE